MIKYLLSPWIISFFIGVYLYFPDSMFINGVIYLIIMCYTLLNIFLVAVNRVVDRTGLQNIKEETIATVLENREKLYITLPSTVCVFVVYVLFLFYTEMYVLAGNVLSAFILIDFLYDKIYNIAKLTYKEGDIKNAREEN